MLLSSDISGNMGAAENNVSDVVRHLEEERPVRSRNSEREALVDLGDRLEESQKRRLLEKEEDFIIAAERFRSSYETADGLIDQEQIDDELSEAMNFLGAEKRSLESRYLDRMGDWNTDTAMLDITHASDQVNIMAHIGRDAPKGGLLHEYADQVQRLSEQLPGAPSGAEIDGDRIYNAIQDISQQLGFSEEETTLYAELTEIKTEVQDIETETATADISPVMNRLTDIRRDIIRAVDDIDVERADYDEEFNNLETTLESLKREVQDNDYDNSFQINQLESKVEDYHTMVSTNLNSIRTTVEDTNTVVHDIRDQMDDDDGGRGRPRRFPGPTGGNDDSTYGEGFLNDIDIFRRGSRRDFLLALGAIGGTAAGIFSGINLFQNEQIKDQNEDQGTHKHAGGSGTSTPGTGYTPGVDHIEMTDEELREFAVYARDELGDDDLYREMLSQASDDGYKPDQVNHFEWESGDPVLETAIDDGTPYETVTITEEMYQTVEEFAKEEEVI